MPLCTELTLSSVPQVSFGKLLPVVPYLGTISAIVYLILSLSQLILFTWNIASNNMTKNTGLTYYFSFIHENKIHPLPNKRHFLEYHQNTACVPYIGTKCRKYFNLLAGLSILGKPLRISPLNYKMRIKMSALLSWDNKYPMKGSRQEQELSSKKGIFNRRHGQEKGIKFNKHGNFLRGINC